MALVRASQEIIIETYTEYKRIFNRSKYVRVPELLRTWVEAICDETEVTEIIEKKIKEKVEKPYVTSYRKYAKPGEYDYPKGKEFELKVEYIRDLRMREIIETLNGSQFAILCKELGISAGEAIGKA